MDQRRSIATELMKPIFDAIPAYRSLHQDDLKTKDWLETARIVNGMDLVITVDTAIAHLAASLGIETWMLNRYDSCWRWTHRKDTTEWYPSMRIFNQPRLGDWGEVVRDVVKELKLRG